MVKSKENKQDRNYKIKLIKLKQRKLMPDFCVNICFSSIIIKVIY